MTEARAERSRLATLEESGGVCRLRFARVLPVSLAQVWRSVTDPELLAAWFPQRVEYLSWDGEARLGAVVRFSMPGDRSDSFDGEVLAFDPPTLIELSWGTDRVQLLLEALPVDGDGDGDQTLLVLQDTFEPIGKAARDAAGWHACLDALERSLTDPAAAGPPDLMAGWARVYPEYVAALGPQAATLPPPVSEA